jgi:hypothetical protein
LLIGATDLRRRSLKQDDAERDISLGQRVMSLLAIWVLLRRNRVDDVLLPLRFAYNDRLRNFSRIYFIEVVIVKVDLKLLETFHLVRITLRRVRMADDHFGGTRGYQTVPPEFMMR